MENEQRQTVRFYGFYSAHRRYEYCYIYHICKSTVYYYAMIRGSSGSSKSSISNDEWQLTIKCN